MRIGRWPPPASSRCQLERRARVECHVGSRTTRKPFSSHLLLDGPVFRARPRIDASVGPGAETVPRRGGRPRPERRHAQRPEGREGPREPLLVHARTLKIPGIHVDGPNGRPESVAISTLGPVSFYPLPRAFAVNLRVISHGERERPWVAVGFGQPDASERRRSRRRPRDGSDNVKSEARARRTRRVEQCIACNGAFRNAIGAR